MPLLCIYYALTMFSPNRQAMLAFKHRLAADAILAKFDRTRPFPQVARRHLLSDEKGAWIDEKGERPFRRAEVPPGSCLWRVC